MVLPDKRDGMLHFMKTGKDSISKEIETVLKLSNEMCPFIHGEFTDPLCYTTNDLMKFLLSFLRRYYITFEFLDINIYTLKRLDDTIKYVESYKICYNLKTFKENLNYVLGIIKQESKHIDERVNLLTCEEATRLDEAITNFSNNAFTSAVVMSVSAVESRLHYLVKNKNKKIYKKHFERATLGQLIKLFDEDEYKSKEFSGIKKMMPKKYKPLIELLNYYRIFSAHPKTKTVGHKAAQSIISLSIGFLLDEENKIPSSLRIHK